MEGLGQRVARGAGWMVLFKLGERLLGLVSTLVLARILVPADFGLVAMATAFAAILDVLTAFSLDLALIQRIDAQRRHYDTAWTFNVIAGACVALAMYALAGSVASFYREPAVKPILEFLAVCFLVQGFQNIGVIAFQKDLELHKEFALGISKKLIQIAVTIGLAFYLRSYWALLVGMLVSRVAGVGLSYLLHPYRPRLSLEASRDLMRFSKWMIATNIVIFLNTRGMDFVIGRFSGASGLGIFSIAYELSNLPTTELVYPISKAVYPGYATVSGDRDRLGGLYLQVLGLTAMVAIPIGTLIACFAGLFVEVLLGRKWEAAVPLIEVLAIYGIVRALHGGTGVVYLALDRPKLVMWVNLTIAAIGIPLIVAGLHWYGLPGVPWAILIAVVIAALQNFRMCARLLATPVWSFYRTMLRPLLGVLVLVAFAFLAREVNPIGSGGIMWILTEFGLAAAALAAYVFTVYGAWYLAGRPDGPEHALLGVIARRTIRAP